MRFGLDLWNPERWHAGRELTSMQRDMDRFFEQFASQFPRLPVNKNIDFVPACDVEETSTQYLLSVDVPGMKKEDLKVELVDNVLTIAGEHKEEKKEEKKNQKITERYQGRFERTFTLPNTTESAKVEANYTDGVLHIAIPKTAAAKPKQIPIGDGKSAPKVVTKEQAAKPSTEIPKSAAA
jgi:HSP20 family protein